jgi:hypothetical protein
MSSYITCQLTHKACSIIIDLRTIKMRNSSLTCCGGAFLNFGIAYPARDNVNPRWLKSRLRCFGNGSINVAISEATSMLKQHKVKQNELD